MNPKKNRTRRQVIMLVLLELMILFVLPYGKTESISYQPSQNELIPQSQGFYILAYHSYLYYKMHLEKNTQVDWQVDVSSGNIAVYFINEGNFSDFQKGSSYYLSVGTWQTSEGFLNGRFTASYTSDWNVVFLNNQGPDSALIRADVFPRASVGKIERKGEWDQSESEKIGIPVIFFSELLFILIPSLIVAGVITIILVRRRKKFASRSPTSEGKFKSLMNKGK